MNENREELRNSNDKKMGKRLFLKLTVLWIFFVVVTIGLNSCTSDLSGHDSTPPTITITTPKLSNNSYETDANSLVVSGRVTDNKSKKPTLNINGSVILLDVDNNFSYSVPLDSTKSINVVVMVAKDESGNTQRKVISVTKPAPPSPPSPPPEAPVRISDNAVLDEGGGQDSVLVAATKADLDEIIKLANVKDTVEIAEMVLNGQAFFVDKNTKVLVIDGDFSFLGGGFSKFV